jgi:putative membrane protein
MTLDTIQSVNAVTDVVVAHGYYDGPGAWWPIVPLLWLLFLAAAFMIFVTRGRRRMQSCGPRSGERVLAERYATGEIDDEEYARRLAVLRRSGGRA